MTRWRRANPTRCGLPPPDTSAASLAARTILSRQSISCAGRRTVANPSPWRNLHTASIPGVAGSPATARRRSTICDAQQMQGSKGHRSRSRGGSETDMAIEKATICPNRSNGSSGPIAKGTRSSRSGSSLMSTDTRGRRRGSTPSARLNYSSFARLTEMPIAIIGLLVPTTMVPEQRETTPRPMLITRLRKSSGGKMQPPSFRNSMISSNLPSRPAQRSWPRAFRRASNRYHARSG